MDLELTLTPDGGDLVLRGNDLGVVYGFENFVLLALFGGNVAASTPTERIATEQAFDYWGNTFFDVENAQQFNSTTERVLNNTPLTSAGRQQIEDAVIADLAWLAPLAEVSVEVRIVTVDTVSIGVRLRQPDNLQEKEFIFLWDATKSSFAGSYQAPVVPSLTALQSSLPTTL